MHHYGPRSVAQGLRPGEFEHLDAATRRKLIRLMARIAEKAYRRGLQHGMSGICTIDPWELRFRRSLDRSPYTDGPGGFTAIERLFMECGVLSEIGFAGANDEERRASMELLQMLEGANK